MAVEFDDEDTTVAVKVRELVQQSGPSLRVVASGETRAVGRVFTLAPATTIGRAQDATIVLSDDGISRHHVRIELVAQVWRVIDLGSRNGTWLNGKPVIDSALKNGDQIELGRHTLLQFIVARAEPTDTLPQQPAGMSWEWRASGTLEFNELADALLNLPSGTVGGRKLLAELVHADDEARVRGILTAALLKKESVDFEARLRTSPPRWLSLRGVVEAGEAAITGRATDVTERRAAEHELKQHSLIFESLHEPVLVTTLTGELLDANGAALKLFALRLENARRRVITEVLRAPSRVTIDAVNHAVRSEGRFFAELEVEAANGRALVCELSVVALRRNETDTVGLVWTARDVSEHKRILQQLGMAERLAAMGTLSAGVAHEINNPLSFLVANLSYLHDELTALQIDREVHDRLTGVVGESLEGTRRITSIVQDLKAFARDEGNTAEPSPVDLGHAVELAHKLAVHTLKHRAKVTLSLERVAPVLAHEHRLAQVVLNLLLNAGQATPETQVGNIIVRVHSPKAGWATLEVEDNGSGIGADVLPHIFDPFFTTKPVGVGTGLGLSIVHGIITSLGGEIAVQSTLGVGTRFTVNLPTVARQATAFVQLKRETVNLTPVRILIIDDEPLVVSSLGRHLRTHEVVGTNSGRDALKLLDAKPFDVVLCDSLMPGMSGMELYEEVGKSSPRVAERFVFMTGGAITERAAAFVADVHRPMLRKPIDLNLLRRTLADVAKQQPS